MNRSKEEIKQRLADHYKRFGGESYMQHLFDLDEEFPSVGIFGPQCISAEVGPGWNRVIRPVVQALSENKCKAGQIKQKWGGLRFYWDYPDEIESQLAEWRASKNDSLPPPLWEERGRIDAIIKPIVAEAERLSYAVCEKCSVSIDPPRGMGHVTECDHCKAGKSTGGRGSTASRG